MDDVQLYIYIALALIYFISRAFKSKKPVIPGRNIPDNSDDPDEYTTRPVREKPLSFEDLLREFSGQKMENEVFPEEEPVIEVAPVVKKKLPDDDEARTYEGYDSYKTKPIRSYEGAYKSPSEIKRLDELVDISAPLQKRFEDIVTEEEVPLAASRLRELLRNKESVRDAVILKEVLDTKYF